MFQRVEEECCLSTLALSLSLSLSLSPLSLSLSLATLPPPLIIEVLVSEFKLLWTPHSLP